MKSMVVDPVEGRRQSIVSMGLFGAEDNECDGATVMESATIGSSSAGVAIRGE
jgi:hypothetical protein